MQLLNPEAVLVPITELRPHPRNPNAGNVDVIAQSITTNGFYGALVAQRTTGFILKGNHTFHAAVQLGAAEVPVFWVDVDDEAALKLLIVDNRSAEFGVRDGEQLAQLLIELEQSAGLEGTGYTTVDYLALLDDLGAAAFQEGLTDEDETPLPPDKEDVVSCLGDVWQIGEHRIACGSSTDPAHVAVLIADQPPQLVWTDPPYNVDYEGKTKDKLKIANDAMSPEEFRDFLGQAMQVTYAAAATGACIYVAYAEVEAIAFHDSLRKAGWKYSQTIIWVKNAAVMGRQDYNWRHEPLLYGWKQGKGGHYFNQDFTQTTVIDDTPNYKKLSKDELVAILEGQRDALVTTVVYVDKPNRNGLHPTMKPVSLVLKFLVASSRTGDIVYDPFGGSGTVAVAAHKTNRCARINELDPRYVDVIVERLQGFTGLSAIRQDGQAYDELKLQRRGQAA